MTSRVRQLESRRRRLIDESAVQRDMATRDAQVIGDSLQAVDRAVAIVQRLRRNPLIVTAVVLGVVVFRRHPLVSWLARGLAVAGAARKFGGTLRELADEPPARDAAGR